MSDEQKIHPIQKLMDNTWLLLALSLAVLFLSYTAWGWFDLASIPDATLP
jgi:hypothetical protein